MKDLVSCLNLSYKKAINAYKDAFQKNGNFEQLNDLFCDELDFEDRKKLTLGDDFGD